MAADRLGYDVLWGVDHVVMPQHVESDYVLSRTPTEVADDAVADLLAPNFELVTTLAYVAGVTERIRLGTAIEVLPIRNPVLNARQLATIDRYSGGRLLLGVGAGWLREEADAMGMPWDRRGARTEEHISLLRTLWTAQDRHTEFHGEFWDLPPMDPEPRPVQRPIPILVGGHSDAAMDRAARIGDGWIAAAMSTDRLADLLPGLDAALARHGRQRSSLTVACGARAGDVSLEAIDRYRQLGVDSLQVPVRSIADMERFAEAVLPGLE